MKITKQGLMAGHADPVFFFATDILIADNI